MTAWLSLLLALLQAVPKVIDLITKLKDEARKADAERNEKTAYERMQLKKQLISDAINAGSDHAVNRLRDNTSTFTKRGPSDQ